MIKIAITGNIASGKSQVEKMLADMGYPVFDADKIAHSVLDSINNFYDYDVFTEGKIDRKKLGKLVFENKELKNKLEEIVHPKVKEAILKIFDDYSDKTLLFVSVPLLFETDFHTLFDKIILVTTGEDIRLKRLMDRNNLTKEEALKRIKSQIPESEKLSGADFVIENNTTLESLKNQLNKVIESIAS